jgi:uncharacterized damage-inducible protein DinB
MKEIMVYYARCNRAINEAMNEVIKKNVPNPYELNLDGYFFKKLGDILDHLFATDMIWMKAFSDIDPFRMDLVKEVRDVPAYGAKIFQDFNAYEISRSKLDRFILEYMNRLNDDIFRKKVSRRMKDGQILEREAYKAMVHFFNHKTHHRGMISNILDNLKIENNFSNMLYLD